ncbi:hypothetical protein ACOSQ3_019030 [Xanthoceras sorbifolium]
MMPSETPLSPIRETPIGFIILDNVIAASQQPPPMTPPTEMSARDAGQAGYHFQKRMKIVGNRLTTPGEKHGGNAGPNKEATKGCTSSKGKESLPLPKPFTSKSSFQSTNNLQTEENPTRRKGKHR